MLKFYLDVLACVAITVVSLGVLHLLALVVRGDLRAWACNWRGHREHITGRVSADGLYADAHFQTACARCGARWVVRAHDGKQRPWRIDDDADERLGAWPEHEGLLDAETVAHRLTQAHE